MSGLLILGAGGHGKVTADILLCQHIPIAGFLDDATALTGKSILGFPVLGRICDCLVYNPTGLVLGIGANNIRKQIAESLGQSATKLWLNAIHPRSILSSSVDISCRDLVIAAGAVVNVDTVLGAHLIINTGATVDHDCRIGDYAHVAPGAHLAGSVTVCEGALIGIGAVVSPGCTIGKWSVVGAGAVVVRDIPDNTIAKGLPARW